MIFTLAACCVYAQKPRTQTLQNNSNRRTNTTSATNLNLTNTKPSCWEIRNKESGDREYRWDTEANVIRWIDGMRTQHNETYQYSASVNTDVNSCDACNEKFQPKKCWKITATKNGQGLEQYMWATENVARRKITNLQADGYQQAKYVETPANDEKSCQAPPANTTTNEIACWKITIGITVTYRWCYERDAQSIVNNAINSGQSASYELSPNKTKDNCYE